MMKEKPPNKSTNWRYLSEQVKDLSLDFSKRKKPLSSINGNFVPLTIRLKIFLMILIFTWNRNLIITLVIWNEY